MEASGARPKSAVKQRSKATMMFSLLLIAALVGTASGIAGNLPVRAQEKILSPATPPYEGVIEIWLSEAFFPGKGSYLCWLTNSAAIFEKANKGVFISISLVAPDVAAQAIADGANLPDAIICSGGILNGPDILTPVKNSARILPAFTGAVSSLGISYGIPISAGAYTILYNKERLNAAGITGSVTETSLESLFKPATSRPRSAVSYALSGAQTDYISYSSALLTMLDLKQATGALPPNIFAVESKKAWADFVLDGRSAGYVCTQKEVFRIRQLEAGGSAFPWTVHQEPCAYTDQLLAIYIFNSEKSDANERQAALLGFADILLSETRQAALADIGAFSVLAGFDFIYPEGSVMHQMEKGLKSEELTVPSMLDWRETRSQIMAVENAEIDAAARINQLSGLLEMLGHLE